jgi:sugar phosphate isomerase/epimerase
MNTLGFCTNAFPANDLDTLIHNELPRFKKIHEAAGNKDFALDLQLSAGIVEELPTRGAEFAAALKAQGLEVGSLNLFPLCDFQAEVVKTKVYSPHWLEPERHRLTEIGARFVAEHLKPSKKFCISTLAGLYHAEGQCSESTFEQLGGAYSFFADTLAQIKEETGCHITLCLEPEPFTSLQKIQDVLDLWEHFEDPACDEHLGINLDCCHFSVMGESPLEAFETFQQAKIPVPKIHASTALKIKGPLKGDKVELLHEMDEIRFLHQSSLLSAAGISHHHDLSEVFTRLEGADQIICHFHMPLFLKEGEQNFDTTEKDTLAVLQKVKKHKGIEVYAETYTWSILGNQFAANAEEGIVKELVFLTSVFST